MRTTRNTPIPEALADTDPASVTQIRVVADETRVHTHLTSAAMAVRRLHAPPGLVRVGLVAGQALLLAGDRVRIEIELVGPVAVEIVEPAGTVAYDMRGGQARWEVDLTLSHGASLTWQALPFVVAAGARVTREFTATVDSGAHLVWRECHTWGRTGEAGGDLWSRTRVSSDGVPVIVEDLILDAATRAGWAGLRGARHLDVVTTVGRRLDLPGAYQYAAEASTVRWWGAQAHLSPVPEVIRGIDSAPL